MCTQTASWPLIAEPHPPCRVLAQHTPKMCDRYAAATCVSRRAVNINDRRAGTLTKPEEGTERSTGTMQRHEGYKFAHLHDTAKLYM